MSVPVRSPSVDDDVVDGDLTGLYAELQTSERGLSAREAARRLTAYGPNQLTRRGGPRWPRQLLDQFTQPLAILLAVAVVLSAATGSLALAVAIAVVIVLNAAFAFMEEKQAERSVESLASYLPERALALRDGHRVELDAVSLVPGDVVLVAEGIGSAPTGASSRVRWSSTCPR